MTRVTNWGGNVVFSARTLHRPTSVEQLQEIVAGGERVRALGSGHSFSTIADTTGDLVSTAALPSRIDVDPAGTVRISGGLRYGDVVGQLWKDGWALPNTGSLPHISVAGACATGTHGSGNGNRVLATSVSAVELVRADGTLAVVRRGDEGFEASVLALGSAGIVVGLTLDLVPTFDVAQWVVRDVPFNGFHDVGDVLSAGYSVSAFTWFESPVFDEVWVKRLATDDPVEPGFLGGTLADAPMHMTRGENPLHCTEQLGSVGPWHERLPHFRLGFTPSSGEEIQSEYLVPREHAPAALRALAALRERFAPVLMVAEIRSIAADDLWASAAHGRDSVGIHFTWHPDSAGVAAVLPEIEAALEPFDARPHWGKAFATAPSRVNELLPTLADAAALWRAHDPSGKFRNEMLDAYLPA